MVETSGAKRNAELERARDQLGRLAWLLDDMFRIPGLNWRFGLDSLIGLLPGGGDMVTAALGLILLMRAFQFRLPAVVIVRMVLNNLLDLLLGAVPVLGDLFDFAWKSNAMNMKLFNQYAREPRKSTFRHWILLALIALLFAGVFVGISAATVFLLRRL